MLTTTPFFKPREGWEPKPSSLDRASAPISPDHRHDLGGADVQAHDEISFRRALKHCVAHSPRCGWRCRASRWQSVGVTHNPVSDVSPRCVTIFSAAVMNFRNLSSTWRLPQAQPSPVGEVEFPGTARVQGAWRCSAARPAAVAPARRGNAAPPGTPCHRAGELRQLRRNVPLVGIEELAARVEEAALAPAAAALCSTTSTSSPAARRAAR